MSEQESTKTEGGKEVSKARKIVSGIILVGLLALLGIEGRAGFGHSSSAKALQDAAPEGSFKQNNLTLEQIDAMMSMSPSREQLETRGATLEYKYSWKSIIRPLMDNIPPTDLYVSFTDGEPPYALGYGTDAPEPLPAAGKGGPPADSSDSDGLEDDSHEREAYDNQGSDVPGSDGEGSEGETAEDENLKSDDASEETN
ncbi:MAG: hypothetical protein ABJZ55_14500 [Fuerstiella sp.]